MTEPKPHLLCKDHKTGQGGHHPPAARTIGSRHPGKGVMYRGDHGQHPATPDIVATPSPQSPLRETRLPHGQQIMPIHYTRRQIYRYRNIYKASLRFGGHCPPNSSTCCSKPALPRKSGYAVPTIRSNGGGESYRISSLIE